MKKLLVILPSLFFFASNAQKADSIFFNLYTDSLKKGVYNYINVDAKLNNGHYLPLMTDELAFSSSAGKWDGNSIIIDKESKIDSVVISAWLKNRSDIKKSITVYIKKNEYEPPLKTEKELLEEWRRKGQRKN